LWGKFSTDTETKSRKSEAYHSAKAYKMNNKSIEASSSTMLMPHETDGTIVSHHTFTDQLHHGTSFFGYNSFHSSFQDSYPVNNVNTSFSNLSNNMSSSIPPLVHQEAFYATNHNNVKKEQTDDTSQKEVDVDTQSKEDETLEQNVSFDA